MRDHWAARHAELAEMRKKALDFSLAEEQADSTPTTEETTP